ncbi:AmiS/UreI family transporter [Clostridium tertium]
MLGVILLYVGIVLINNGVARLFNINDKSVAIMNIFVGCLSLICNIIILVQGQFDGKMINFYLAGTGLLFAFTYLYAAFNTIFKLDTKLYGWYSLFVAINSIPAGMLCFNQFGGDWKMGVIWLLWGILWLTAFIECVLKKTLGKFVGYLSVFEGIFAAWIPGLLILIGLWN